MENYREFLIKNGIATSDKAEKLAKGVNTPIELIDKLSKDQAINDDKLVKAYAGAFRKKSLADVLIEEGAVDVETIQQLMVEAGNVTSDLGNILLDKKIITEEMLAKCLLKQLALSLALNILICLITKSMIIYLTV